MQRLSPIIVAALALSLACSSAPPAVTPAPQPEPAPPEPGSLVEEDPYLWLEDVAGDRSMAWVKEQNAHSMRELEATPGFEAMRARIRAILDSKEKIPWVTKRGKFLVNLWKDDEHPRGLWRRTTLAEYRKPSPKWEVLLDLDALGKAEKESWVWQGADCLYPAYERCLLSLSRGGADAVVVREFDVAKKAFVKDGFALPEAKSLVGWKDLDTIYVGTDFGPGSFTDSGYPRIAKEWTRGTPLSAAKTLLEIDQGYVEGMGDATSTTTATSTTSSASRPRSSPTRPTSSSMARRGGSTSPPTRTWRSGMTRRSSRSAPTGRSRARPGPPARTWRSTRRTSSPAAVRDSPRSSRPGRTPRWRPRRA